jgi:hypothetical protein
MLPVTTAFILSVQLRLILKAVSEIMHVRLRNLLFCSATRVVSGMSLGLCR